MRHMLNFLSDHGDKAVGAYYRNVRMKKADKDHQPITKEGGDRSGDTEAGRQKRGYRSGETEGDHKRGKEGNHPGQKTAPVLTSVWVLDISMITFAFAALIRLQNGFFYDRKLGLNKPHTVV